MWLQPGGWSGSRETEVGEGWARSTGLREGGSWVGKDRVGVVF